MYPYKFQLTSDLSAEQVKRKLAQFNEPAFELEWGGEANFLATSVNEKLPKDKKQRYQVPIVIEANVVEGNSGVKILCQAKLNSTALFRQLLISIVLIGVIMMSWRQYGTTATAIKWLCGIVVAGSFMSSYKALTTTANFFKAKVKELL